MNSLAGPVKDAVVLPDSVDKSVVESEHKNHILNAAALTASKMYLISI